MRRGIPSFENVVSQCREKQLCLRKTGGVQMQTSMANDADNAEGDEGPPKDLGWVTEQFGVGGWQI